MSVAHAARVRPSSGSMRLQTERTLAREPRAPQLGREGIEPLVVHLTCFSTTALQAAVRSTTRDAGMTNFQAPMSKPQLPMASWDLGFPWTLGSGTWDFPMEDVGIEPTSAVLQTAAMTTSANPPV